MGVNLTSAGPAEQAAPKRYSSGDLETSLRELVSDGSLEFSGGDAAQIDEVAEFLPFGTPVFVPVLPLHAMDSRLEVITRLRERGLDPVPHLAARRMPSKLELLDFLSAAAGHGVHRVLLIGGDNREVTGPFED